MFYFNRKNNAIRAGQDRFQYNKLESNMIFSAWSKRLSVKIFKQNRIVNVKIQKIEF